MKLTQKDVIALSKIMNKIIEENPDQHPDRKTVLDEVYWAPYLPNLTLDEKQVLLSLLASKKDNTLWFLESGNLRSSKVSIYFWFWSAYVALICNLLSVGSSLYLHHYKRCILSSVLAIISIYFVEATQKRKQIWKETK